MKKVLITIFSLLFLVGCSNYLKSYRDYNYDGHYFVVETRESIPVRCTFVKFDGVDVLRIFQTDEEGNIVIGYGTDIIFYTQEKERLRFEDSKLVLRDKNGRNVRDMINHGLIGSGSILLYGLRHEPGLGLKTTDLYFFKGEKNDLSKYFN
jgi:hypothetical protein